ncbi:hypothetical protein HY414_00175 [Candidatus Kaiserbacteria bacterium]|nr:hypothetical protein [Candidatus Kaiserbacteria bacterium]
MGKIKFFMGDERDWFRFRREVKSNFIPLVGTRTSVSSAGIPSGKIISSFYCIHYNRWEAVILLDHLLEEDDPLIQIYKRSGWEDSDELLSDQTPVDDGG